MVTKAFAIVVVIVGGGLLWYLFDQYGGTVLRAALPVGLITGFVLAHIFWTSANPRAKLAESLLGEVDLDKGGGTLPSDLSTRIITWCNEGTVDEDNPLETIYRWIWQHWGKPFTHISQDSVSSKKAAWLSGMIFGTLLVSWGLVHLDDIQSLWVVMVSLGVGFVLGQLIWPSSGRRARQAQKLIKWMDGSTGSIPINAAHWKLIRDWQGRRSQIVPDEQPS